MTSYVTQTIDTVSVQALPTVMIDTVTQYIEPPLCTLTVTEEIYTVDYAAPMPMIAETFASSTKGMNINMADATSSVIGSNLTAVSSFVQWNEVTGSKFADIISGASWGETINAGAGNDTIIGSGGADVLDGGAGIDTVDYSASTSYEGTPMYDIMEGYTGHVPDLGVNVNLKTGLGSWGDANGDTYKNIENVTGSARDDILVGNDAANVLKGGAGFDNLSGGAGNDKLEGGTGDDQLNGGKGSDQLNGGEGSDTAVYSESASGVNINLKTGYGNGGDATGDRFSSIENVTGSNFNDTMAGNNQANLLDGGNGNDQFKSDLGADTYNGGSGTDTVNYSASSEGVQVDLTPYTYRGGAAPMDWMIAENQKAHVNGRGGDAEGDQLNGVEKVIGTNFADNLKGDDNANTFEAGKGDDTLNGGGGNDVLTGGAGNDTFIHSFGSGNDIVTDFIAGSRSGDKIVFEQKIHAFTAEPTPALTYQDIMSHATQVGKNVVFNFDGETLTLNNVMKSQINAGDIEVVTTMIDDYQYPQMQMQEAPMIG